MPPWLAQMHCILQAADCGATFSITQIRHARKGAPVVTQSDVAGWFPIIQLHVRLRGRKLWSLALLLRS